MAKPTPTGREITFGENEIIVSKTDTRGIITYANDVFQRVSGYSEKELLGQPHNIIRHPAMPRCVFKLLWDTIAAGQEIFAYVLNLNKHGDGYWVFAHVTPSFDKTGKIIGYHSNRRVPYPDAVEKIRPIYRRLLEEEQRHPASPKDAMAASTRLLLDMLGGTPYHRFVFTLSTHTTLDHSIH